MENKKTPPQGVPDLLLVHFRCTALQSRASDTTLLLFRVS